jgi:class 3 adenylate cyclase
LNKIKVNLASFLPKYIVDNEDLLTQEFSDFRAGTFMFADVSGFTALSEELQKASAVEGAEIMTHIINEFFTTMLEILSKSDGQMLKFAGDALLTFFPVGDEADNVVTAKAIRTGLRMQRAMQENFQPIIYDPLRRTVRDKTFELTMSIGIARGQLFESLVGNSSQRDHIIMGSLPAKANSAEEAGVRDDVIIDADMADIFRDDFTLQPAPVGEGYFQVIDDLGDDLSDFELTSVIGRRRGTVSSLLPFGEQRDAMDELRQLTSKVDNIARFVATEVVEKLAITGDRVEPQNRPATVIFAYFKGIATMLEAWGEGELPRITRILARFYALMQQVIAAHGGALTRSDPYQEGSKLLITFGAPIAHPDDPFRATATAIEMQKQLQQMNEQLSLELPDELLLPTYIEMRMGITHGQAFASEVGWKQRREYTVMGDDVNLAARIMSKAQMGEILISERVYTRVDRFFVTDACEPMLMKGKSRPVQAYKVWGWEGSITDVSRTSNTRFVGRDTLLLTLTFALEQAKARRRRTIVLVGEAGMGKTRIAKQFIQQARDKQFQVAWATCHSLDNPRITWASIISQLLEIDDDADLPEQQQMVRDGLERIDASNLETQVNDLLFMGRRHGTEGEAHRMTGEYSPISSTDELSAKMLHGEELWIDELVVALLNAVTKNTPALIVLDDLHRAHAQALRVFQHVHQQIKSGKLILMAAFEPTLQLEIEVNPTYIEDLLPEEAFRMATDILYAPTLSQRLSEQLWDHSHGRPLFVESLLQAWQEANEILIDEGVADLKSSKEKVVVPDFIRNIIISNVDLMSPDEQQVLYAAAVLSVLDPNVYVEQLHEVAQLGSPQEINDAGVSLLHKGTMVVVDESDGRMRLHYGFVRRTVYESLSRQQRQNLHLAAADYWEAHGETEEQFFLRMEHMVHGGKLTDALQVMEQAGLEAEERGDVDGAINFYQHAVDLFPNDRTIQKGLSKFIQRAAMALIRSKKAQQAQADAEAAEDVPEPSTEAEAEQPRRSALGSLRRRRDNGGDGEE